MTFGLHRAPPTAHHPPKEHSASNAHRNTQHRISSAGATRASESRSLLTACNTPSATANAFPAAPASLQPSLQSSQLRGILSPISHSRISKFPSRGPRAVRSNQDAAISQATVYSLEVPLESHPPSSQASREEKRDSRVRTRKRKKSTEKRRVIRLLLRGYTGSDGQSDAQHERIINVETL